MQFIALFHAATRKAPSLKIRRHKVLNQAGGNLTQ